MVSPESPPPSDVCQVPTENAETFFRKNREVFLREFGGEEAAVHGRRDVVLLACDADPHGFT